VLLLCVLLGSEGNSIGGIIIGGIIMDNNSELGGGIMDIGKLPIGED